jgi:effector-binding domain-containing protein
MKTLKTIGIGLIGVILLLLVIAFFLPSKVHIERSIEIKGNPANAYNLVNRITEWKQWSPWHKLDTNAKWIYSEQTEGTGAWYTWESEVRNVGSGKLTITNSKPYEIISTALQFEKMTPAHSDFIFTPTTDGYKLTWTMDSDMGLNPIGRWFGVFMDRMIGPDYEKGLQAIKEISERVPEKETIAGFDFEQRDMQALMIAGIRETVKMSEFNSAKFANWFGAIGKTLETGKIAPTGPPMAIYYSFENETTDIEAAMPVSSIGKDVGMVKFHELPACKALVVKYLGDYSGTARVYAATFDYFKTKGIEMVGAPMEIYITDPMMEKDTAKWLTEIVFPVK